MIAGDPAISIAPSGDAGVFINPQTLEKGEVEIIIERLKAILEA